jgi:CheY-like chemotaxis protein
VLIADDEETIREPLERILRQLGYQARAVADGPALLAALEAAERPVDLVLMDIVMPGGGTTLLRDVLRRWPAARVLVISGYGPEGEAARMLAAGAHAFLQKPFGIVESQAAIARALR